MTRVVVVLIFMLFSCKSQNPPVYNCPEVDSLTIRVFVLETKLAASQTYAHYLEEQIKRSYIKDTITNGRKKTD